MPINTIITDSNSISLEVLKNSASNIEGLHVIGAYKNLSSINSDLKNIDLIFFDITSKDIDETLEEINKIREINKNILFIATSFEINSELVAKVLKADVKDFLLKPIIDNILNASIKKIKDFKSNSNQDFSNTICIYSNKGGCGKTSVAVNLAYETAKIENTEKVCLLDLNYTSQDASTFLNIEPKHDIDYILSNIENADERFILSVAQKYKETNLYVFSINNSMKLSSKLSYQNVLKIINHLKNVFRWIIIDMTGEINEFNLAILNNSDLILMIGLMNMVSIRNCQKSLELFSNAGFSEDKVKFIINRYIQNSEITVEDVENATGKTIYEKIPNNYLTLIDAINLGSAVGEINPQSNIAGAYSKLAQNIVNTDFTSLKEANDKNYNHGIFNLMKRMGE